MSPELLLGWLGITEPPVDPFSIADALDVIVAREDLRPYASVLAMSSTHAGILVNTASEALEQRFAVAHELGHLVLHDGVEFLDREFNGHDPIEVEADLYATRLLLPGAWVETRAAGGASIEAMAAAFGVTESMMRERVRALSLPEDDEDN